ncbi:MAG: FkbM family methyltransferase [Paracoccaceae bacterium]
MNLRKRLKKWGGEIVHRLRRVKPPADRAVDAPEFHALGPGDIAIDCGANLGLIARIMGANGAEVHAFEPNPDAFAVLQKNTRHLPGVHCHQQAVLDAPGQMTLYLHLNYARDPMRFASGSSLIADKRNVDDRRGVEVEVIDLVAFIAALDRPVKLMKVDIEGAEYALLNAMIDRGVMDRVERIFVETHAHAAPSLREADTKLRARVAELGLGDKIDLNWI